MSLEFIKDKAREISYALIKVAFNIKRPELRNRLENLAFELMENAARAAAGVNQELANNVLADVSAIDGLVRLAHSIYEIEPVNATILVRELDKFNSAICQLAKADSAIAELPDLEKLFSDYPMEQPDTNVVKPAIENIENKEEPQVSNGLNSAIRQSAIIERIRQRGNCRLKDLLIDFPEVSERTLRYDLQGLCAKGAIERIGNGGPASYYRPVSEIRLIASELRP